MSTKRDVVKWAPSKAAKSDMAPRVFIDHYNCVNYGNSREKLYDCIETRRVLHEFSHNALVRRNA